LVSPVHAPTKYRSLKWTKIVENDQRPWRLIKQDGGNSVGEAGFGYA